MPHILMIATGGTIACCETAHGLSPALDSAALLGALPELSALCTVETLDLMQLDSTDVTAADRQRMHRRSGKTVRNSTALCSRTARIRLRTPPRCSPTCCRISTAARADRLQLPMGVPDSDAPRNLLDAFALRQTDAQACTP